MKIRRNERARFLFLLFVDVLYHVLCYAALGICRVLENEITAIASSCIPLTTLWIHKLHSLVLYSNDIRLAYCPNCFLGPRFCWCAWPHNARTDITAINLRTTPGPNAIVTYRTISAKWPHYSQVVVICALGVLFISTVFLVFYVVFVRPLHIFVHQNIPEYDQDEDPDTGDADLLPAPSIQDSAERRDVASSKSPLLEPLNSF